MKQEIEVRIESLKAELDKNKEELIDEINQIIRTKVLRGENFFPEVKRVKLNKSILRIRSYKGKSKCRIHSKKIGLIFYGLNKNIDEKYVLKKSCSTVEEIVQKICNNLRPIVEET